MTNGEGARRLNVSISVLRDVPFEDMRKYTLIEMLLSLFFSLSALYLTAWELTSGVVHEMSPLASLLFSLTGYWGAGLIIVGFHILTYLGLVRLADRQRDDKTFLYLPVVLYAVILAIAILDVSNDLVSAYWLVHSVGWH